MNRCVECKGPTKRSFYKYCSNDCQSKSQYKKYILAWRAGLVNGSRGINTKTTSRHIKRFLVEKFGEKCFLCGWKKKHPVTNKVPLEIDHIDGVAENNQEANLRLLCPNCHSLTPSFRNLNKGNGRRWRREKYVKTNR